LEGLNSGQKQAVDSENPAILIQAGPGTGKTRTLTAKIAWLISERRTDPSAILALTFTNKAARELTRRIDTFLPNKNNTVLASTFHGFCLKFLKEMFGFNAGLMEDRLRLELIKNAVEAVVPPDVIPDEGTSKKRGKKLFSGKKALDQLDRMISLCKQQLRGPADDLSCLADKCGAGVLGQVYTAYQQQCHRLNLVDFEELIFLFYGLLKASPKALAQIQNRFTHIFIDEYQDLNLAQYELVRLLAQTSHLVVIGDPDQSIYGFRGSDNRYFKRFATDYPGCEQIFLDQNYRSTQTILDASFQMISRSVENSGSRIFSDFNTAQRLIVKQTVTQTAEAVAVGKMIENLVGGLSFFSMDTGRLDPGDSNTGKEGPLGEKEYSFSDVAILFRTKKQGDTFAEVFEREGIPFQTADKKTPYAQEGIEQVLSLFRVITRRAHKRDYQVLSDHFKRLSQETGMKIPKDTDDPVQSLITPVFDQTRDQNSLACLETLVDFLKARPLIQQKEGRTATYETLCSLAQLYPDPESFMNYLVLDQDPDHLAGSIEKVSLMTLHSAKGLEYPVVFVTGCEQGLIPFARDGIHCDNLEEERRLFYVGMTRAMDILCLTYAQKRRIYGVSKTRQRSFFIDDIEKELAQYETSVTGVKQAKREIQLELFG
jgi:superfamily I DNA/RNA helicase